MKVLPEIYKGIEFIRISSLPEEQKAFLLKNLPSDKIIKILRDNVLLNDCIQYKDFLQWQDEMQHKSQPGTIAQAADSTVTEPKPAFKLAYK